MGPCVDVKEPAHWGKAGGIQGTDPGKTSYLLEVQMEKSSDKLLLVIINSQGVPKNVLTEQNPNQNRVLWG